MKKCVYTLELSYSLSLNLFSWLHIIANSDVEESVKLAGEEGEK